MVPTSTQNEDKFIQSLKKVVSNQKFTTKNNYEKTVSWIKWTSLLKYGTLRGLDKVAYKK